eukprot:1914937-Lingulodinium_polyedra.AAC.1
MGQGVGLGGRCGQFLGPPSWRRQVGPRRAQVWSWFAVFARGQRGYPRWGGEAWQAQRARGASAP